MRSLDAISRWAALLLLLLFIGFGKAQEVPPIQDSRHVTGSTTQAPTSPGENDPVARRMAEQLLQKRNATRQQEIVDDTTKLLDLAKQLKAEVDKSNKNQLSLGVVKKAEEIEKLAKNVKEKMKSGQ
jgi:type VI protein secretion system component VasF